MTTRLGDYAMRASINGWAVFQLCPHNMSSPLLDNVFWQQVSKWYERKADAS